MKISVSAPAFLTRQRHLWRVPTFRTRAPNLWRPEYPGLGPMTVSDLDEDALVVFRPGKPLWCHRCGRGSDDRNPEYDRFLILQGEDYGLSPFGCEHIEEVVELIQSRCRDGEK